MGYKQKLYRVVELEVERSGSVESSDYVVRDVETQKYVTMAPEEYERFSKNLLPCVWIPTGPVSTILAAALRMEPKPDNQAWAICYTEKEDVVRWQSISGGVA